MFAVPLQVPAFPPRQGDAKGRVEVIEAWGCRGGVGCARRTGQRRRTGLGALRAAVGDGAKGRAEVIETCGRAKGAAALPNGCGAVLSGGRGGWSGVWSPPHFGGAIPVRSVQQLHAEAVALHRQGEQPRRVAGAVVSSALDEGYQVSETGGRDGSIIVRFEGTGEAVRFDGSEWLYEAAGR